ncbi:hypothetical protein [Mastigocoleus testarum]|uniref:Uncharacterized protein n=1 Tax=Mastigocoleus testarum BC008 TaxID=371196 RepID=A0A0V7ZJX1_9CYAN|nr:hypothetical protein [Mastigocoleus testarum]KST64072.1 hypothetical protein BC008_40475 [Mastigocoleus testarum BC008]KST64782.1 hypothetical protein BC008_41450 [Mastigocoleus testarum BC008]
MNDIYKELVETYKKLGTLSFALAEDADNLRITKHGFARGERMIVSFEVLLNAHNRLVQGKHYEAAVLLQKLKDDLTKVSRAEAIYKK